MCPDRTDPARSQPAPADSDPGLSDLALRAASSNAIFDRGLAYARAGAVSELTPLAGTEPGVAAEVLGTDRYSTEIWLDAGAVAGRCDYPYASDGGFCKHQVAVALVWRGQTLRDSRQALHDFLHRQSVADLADRLLSLSDIDPGREYVSWQQAATYRHRAEAVLPLLQQATARNPGVALSLAMHALWLHQLRQEFRAKRNFVRDLPVA